MSLLLTIGLTIDSLFVLICFIGASFLIIQQIFYIYNDLPYYYLNKDQDIERHYGICVLDNKASTYNPYNKGCLANFSYIIGPSIFHFFFPLPKYNQTYDIIENNEVFNKIYPAHPFQLHNYLESIDYPDFQETWEEQVNQMNPEYFLKTSEENYGNAHII